MRTGVTAAALLIPLRIVVDDLHGLNTLQHQPAKIAAIDAIWQTQKGAPMVLFGLPDVAARETECAIEVPKLASLLLTHELDGEVKGLDAFAGKQPPVAPLCFARHGRRRPADADRCTSTENPAPVGGCCP